MKPKLYMDSFLPTIIEKFLSTKIKNKANKQIIKSRNFAGHRNVNFRNRFLFNSVGFWAQFKKIDYGRASSLLNYASRN